MDNIVQLLISVLGAKAATDEMETIIGKGKDMGDELLRLSGATLTLNGVFNGMKEALQWGGQLTDLSARTGQAVSDIVTLQRAFDLAGMSGDNVGQMINRLQRSISGLNEMGQATGGAFAALGLSPEQLRQLNAVEQIQALTRGFERIDDPARRASVSIQLFGREGGQMLALFQNGTLERAAEETGRLGERMAESAAVFDRAEENLELISLRLREMYVVAVQQVLPVMETVSKVLGGMNFSALGAAGATGGLLGGALLLGSGFIGQMEMVMARWAGSTAIGNTLAQSIGLPVANALQRGVYTAMGPAIAAVVVAAIVQGVVQAYVESERAKNSLRAGIQRETGSIVGGFSSAGTSDEMRAAEQRAREQITEAEKQIDQINQSYAGSARRNLTETERIRIDELKQQITSLRQALDTSEGRKAEIVDAEALRRSNAEIEKMIPLIGELQKAKDKAAFESLSDTDQRNRLGSDRAVLEDRLAQDKPEGLSDQAWLAQRLAWEKELFEIKKQLEELDRRAADQAKKREDAAFRQFEAEQQIMILQAQARGDKKAEEDLKLGLQNAQQKRELMALGIQDLSIADRRTQAERMLADVEAARRAAREASEARVRDYEEAILAQQSRIAQIEANGLLTDAEMYRVKQRALDEEIAQRRQLVNELEQQARLARMMGDEQGFRDNNSLASGQRRDIGNAQARRDQLGPDPQDWSAQWNRALGQLRNQWQVTARTINQSFVSIAEGGIRTISQGLTNLVMGTMTWREALSMIGVTILTTIVSAIIEMGVRWLAFEIMKAVLGPQLQLQAQMAMMAASVPIAAAQSLIWAGPAALATIATMGGAAAAAPAQVLMAKMATIGLAGFRRGGWSGDGAEDEPAGFVHGQEFIFSAPAVRAIGRENLEQFHTAATESPSRTSRPTMRRTGGQPAGSGGTNVTIAVVDDAKRGDGVLRSRRGPKRLINLIGRHGGL
ncbi:MAG: hypothetical protein SFV32_12770 [Opitutaceae bacterium]|nr:hypothetical protein [Opitutaceae bacterium]